MRWKGYKALCNNTHTHIHTHMHTYTHTQIEKKVYKNTRKVQNKEWKDGGNLRRKIIQKSSMHSLKMYRGKPLQRYN